MSVSLGKRAACMMEPPGLKYTQSGVAPFKASLQIPAGWLASPQSVAEISIGPPKGIEVRDFILNIDFYRFSVIFIKNHVFIYYGNWSRMDWT